MNNKLIGALALLTMAGVGTVSLAHVDEVFGGLWKVTEIAVTPVANTFAGLQQGDRMQVKSKWYDSHKFYFDVKSARRPFEKLNFFGVERSADPPPCDDVTTQNLETLLAMNVNALIGTGYVGHDDGDDDAHADPHLMVFIPCKTAENEREFRLIIRAFNPGTGGGTVGGSVTHNGTIHGDDD